MLGNRLFHDEFHVRTRKTFFVSILVMSLATASVPSLKAAELRFRQHDLNPESTYSACAVLDVNRDGKLDIVCGGIWYEAPTWKRHTVHDVEVIRGRYDDYSNLPLDVNGDGWLDLISANYRSSTMYWIEHPGKKLGPWTAHTIAKPGPMETARLHDIDGDGQLDILPNGVRFAAWWRYERSAAGSEQSIRWIRHELPAEVAGHGVGFGDIDGDGRGDIVGPRGWLKAPKDRRKDRWTWNPEFQLHRDCGLPILVSDVDGDGDNDIIWSRGHKTGLYWLEHISNNASGREWTFHVIDTSWSQAHSLLLGDLDLDGRPELIAGKRYMGHDGKDLGEYDPMLICAYSFLPKSRSWKRQLISAGWAAGFGLDPELIDLDGDGDLDIVGPGRNGVFWFENLLKSKGKSDQVAIPKWPAADYDDHTRLMTFKDAAGASQPVKSYANWGIRRAHILANLQKVMGPLPDSSQRVPLDPQFSSKTKTPKYTRHKLTFAAEPGDRVPAYLLVPNDLKAPVPAMLCLQQTTRNGKDEPAGLAGKPTMHYAHELANRGYICVVPDYPSFGEYKYDFQKASDKYASGTMKAIWNNLRAVDLLESLPDVNRDRIGCIGHSLGGHNALFTAAFDQRIAVIVSSCGYTSFLDDDVPSWTGERYMPRIKDVYKNDANQIPFDFHEIAGALAPRPFFTNAPLRDGDFKASGVKKVIASAKQVYDLIDASDRLHAVYPDSPHDFPDEIRQRSYEWLDKWLK